MIEEGVDDGPMQAKGDLLQEEERYEQQGEFDREPEQGNGNRDGKQCQKKSFEADGVLTAHQDWAKESVENFSSNYSVINSSRVIQNG